jgi:hypothetical protein
MYHINTMEPRRRYLTEAEDYTRRLIQSARDVGARDVKEEEMTVAEFALRGKRPRSEPFLRNVDQYFTRVYEPRSREATRRYHLHGIPIYKNVEKDSGLGPLEDFQNRFDQSEQKEGWRWPVPPTPHTRSRIVYRISDSDSSSSSSSDEDTSYSTRGEAPRPIERPPPPRNRDEAIFQRLYDKEVDQLTDREVAWLRNYTGINSA